MPADPVVVESLLASAGLRAVRAGDGTWWEIDAPVWVRAYATREALVLESPVAKMPCEEQVMHHLAHLGQAWGLGRLQWEDEGALAMVSLPFRSLDEVGAGEVRALFQHLVPGLDQLREGRAPTPPACAPLPVGALEEVVRAAGLHAETDGAVLRLYMDPGDGRRFCVRIASEGPQVRFDAWLESPPPPTTPAMVNHLNCQITVGTVALGPQGQLGWAYALPADWFADRPDRLEAVLDHAAAATAGIAELLMPREALMLPRLVPPDHPGAEGLYPLVDHPLSPRIAVSPVDGQTLQPISAAPTFTWTVQQAVAALATRMGPWRAQGSMLVCSGACAASQVMIPAFLEDAHARLGAATLVVALPHPDWILAAADAAFLREQLPQEPLCRGLVWVERGRILGIA